MPFQTLAAVAIATRAKVNIPFTVAACFVTNPLTEIPIRASQLAFGRWLHEHLGLAVPKFGEIEFPPGFSNFIIGFLVMGILLSLISYPLVRLFSAILPQHLPIKRHPIRPARRIKPSREEARRRSAN